MKNALLTLLVFITTNIYSNGVIIVDASTQTYFQLINSNVNVDVSNQVAIVTSTQKFLNNTGEKTNGKYGFPMPVSGSAISLRWKVGDNEWETANFSSNEQDNSLPNSGSGDSGNSGENILKAYLGNSPLYFDIIEEIENNTEILVELKYVQLLDYKFDIVTFNYPSDYSTIQNGIIPQEQKIEFNLNSDRTITNIETESFSPIITNSGNNATLTFSEIESNSIANTTIKYSLNSDELGLISFSTLLPDEESSCDSYGNGYLGLIIEPESSVNTEVIEKNFTLIIDSSGSMREQNRMNNAKDAATYIVNNLNEGDNFNIIDFDDKIVSFKTSHVPYSNQNKIDALDFISNLNALGGTNISNSLTTAINQFNAASEGKANIILFFTDGEATYGETSTNGILDLVENATVSKETEIYLYTIGIGTGINEQLITLLANENNGISKFLEDEKVEEGISDFYKTIRNPVLLNTELTITPDIITEIHPNNLPNLYKGSQLILTGRYTEAADINIKLTGNAFNNNVEYNYDISLANTKIEENNFLPKLWAKNKIDDLTNYFYTLTENSNEANNTETTIENISLCYEVLSKFTSLTGTPLSINEFISKNKNEFKYRFTPNPFQDQTTLYVELVEPQKIEIFIYDSNGKIIKVITKNCFSGKNEIIWDGTNNSGKEIQRGIYFYTFKISNQEHFGKIIKI